MMKIFWFIVIIATLQSCDNEETPSNINELDSTQIANVTLNVVLRKEEEKKVKASAYFTLNGNKVTADEAKVFINGTEVPLDSTKWTEVIKEDGYIVDIKTPDGVNDTEMNADDLKGIVVPDTLVMKRSDNGIAINNLTTAISALLTSNNSPVKIISVNDGILVIDPSTLGASNNGLYLVNIQLSSERRSELSNKMKSVTRQLLEKKNVNLRIE